MTLTAVGLADAFGRSASAAVPAAWIETTVKAAVTFTSRAARIAIGEIVSATAADLARRSLRAMVFESIEGGGRRRRLPDRARSGSPGESGRTGRTRQGRVRLLECKGLDPLRSHPRPRPRSQRQPSPRRPSRIGVGSSTRRVVPSPGAVVYLVTHGLKHPDNPPVRASSGVDGRFRFDVPRSDFDTTLDDTPWSYTTIVARARGYGFGVANDDGRSKDLTLKLARDDVPISGRILGLEGQPIAGVIVKVLDLGSPIDGSLDAWLKAADERKEYHGFDDTGFFAGRMVFQPNPPVIPPVTTGPDGRFRIEAIGQERVATLQFEGPTIETVQVKVRTRPGPTIRIPPPRPVTIYGATFEHLAGPSRPIEGVVRDKETRRPLAGVIISGPHWDPLGNQTGSGYLHIQTITDQDGHYRLTGLPQGRERFILAVPPSDMPYFEQSRLRGEPKADLEVPRHEDLPYLRARIPVDGSHGTGPLRLDIGLKRGVWVSGRVVEPSDRTIGSFPRGVFRLHGQSSLEGSPRLSRCDAPHSPSHRQGWDLPPGGFPGPRRDCRPGF